MSDKLTIVNAGYRSTNIWVISAGRKRIIFDLGWPGQFGALRANLTRLDIPLAEITHGLASHYHIDHAGSAQDLKNCGMRLIVTPEQLDWIPAMQKWIKPADNFTTIRTDDNLPLKTDASRQFFKELGIAGEIIHTPGHSDDSVSLLLDNGIAFTGDLTPISRISAEDAQVVAASWQKLRDGGAKTIHPGHGPPLPIEQMM